MLVIALVIKSLYYINGSMRGSRRNKIIPVHARGIPTTFIPTPAGNPWIPRDSRRPHPRAHL